MNLHHVAEDATTLILTRVPLEGDMTRTPVAVQKQGEDTIQMFLLHEKEKTPTLMRLHPENVSRKSQTATHRHRGEEKEVQTLIYLRAEERAVILTCHHLERGKVWGRA